MPSAASLKVLVADDQLTIRSLVKASLQSLGVENVRFAIDGEQALSMLQAAPAHIVFSDVNMPKVDGLQLLQAIRSDPVLQSTAVIMLTGHADKEVVQKAVALKVNNFIVKPFSTEKLKEKLEAVLGPLTP